MSAEIQENQVLLRASAEALESFATTVRAALCVAACRGLTDAQLASGAVMQAVGFYRARTRSREMQAETLPLAADTMLLCAAANVATWMVERARASDAQVVRLEGELAAARATIARKSLAKSRRRKAAR